MSKYYIVKDDDRVGITLHHPTNTEKDYLDSFIDVWIDDGEIDSPFKTLDEAEEFIVKFMELLKE